MCLVWRDIPPTWELRTFQIRRVGSSLRTRADFGAAQDELQTCCFSGTRSCGDSGLQLYTLQGVVQITEKEQPPFLLLPLLSVKASTQAPLSLMALGPPAVGEERKRSDVSGKTFSLC